MAEWIAEILGWNLSTNSSTYMHTVSQYVYEGGIIIIVVGVLILFSELSGILRDIVSYWSRK